MVQSAFEYWGSIDSFLDHLWKCYRWESVGKLCLDFLLRYEDHVVYVDQLDGETLLDQKGYLIKQIFLFVRWWYDIESQVDVQMLLHMIEDDP